MISNFSNLQNRNEIFIINVEKKYINSQTHAYISILLTTNLLLFLSLSYFWLFYSCNVHSYQKSFFFIWNNNVLIHLRHRKIFHLHEFNLFKKCFMVVCLDSIFVMSFVNYHLLYWNFLKGYLKYFYGFKLKKFYCYYVCSF